jgi:hypothetical protein
VRSRCAIASVGVASGGGGPAAGSWRAAAEQQPTGVAVAGFGDPALHPGRSRGVFGGHQSQVGADGAAGEPSPVADFSGQAEGGQRGDATQAALFPNSTTAGASPRRVIASVIPSCAR